MKERLQVGMDVLQELNEYLLSSPLIDDVTSVVHRYGSVEEINQKAKESSNLNHLLKRLKHQKSPYLHDLKWLMKKRDEGAFISISQYRRNVLGEKGARRYFQEGNAVTLEISALQFFPWLIREAERSIAHQEIMPGRFIRVRSMKEQEEDQGDILAIAAAMQIIGASYVESLDTRGTDGSNIHLGGPETITGYFGGIGMPNDYALKWVHELLYYYTNYGINEVLNINAGTLLLGYILYGLGINISFKISVFMGNDNPYSVFWTLFMAKLMARDDGSTPLSGFNLSNSVNVDTLKKISSLRNALNLENQVRIEHHITETYRSIVRQPYNRRDDLLEIVQEVSNIAAKHEGGEVEDEKKREHSSSILDYFRTKEEILSSNDMERLEENYLDKHKALNNTAWALTEKGFSFIGARSLHRL